MLPLKNDLKLLINFIPIKPKNQLHKNSTIFKILSSITNNSYNKTCILKTCYSNRMFFNLTNKSLENLQIKTLVDNNNISKKGMEEIHQPIHHQVKVFIQQCRCN